MKKLLFALAGTVAFAAFADDPSAGDNDIDVLGFENFDLTLQTVSGAVVNRTDSGIEGQGKWVCTGDDASLVKTYGDDNAAAPSLTTYPAPFTDGGDQYLALDTNGSELQRYFTTDTTNGTPTAVSTDPLYIDTLVQFTPSESAPTSADLDGAKLAIWLGVVDNVTNLYVQGLQYSDAEISVSAPVAYKITNVIPQPGTWYRLTVKAIPFALSGAQMVSAFTVAIDGTAAVAEQCLLVGDALDIATGGADGSICTADEYALISANKVFGSMADLTQTGLSCVGFKGTGAIDDFVVTTETPSFNPPAVDFTLAWPAGLTAVSYSIDGGAAVAIAANAENPFHVPGVTSGAAVQFIVQNADGAQKTLSATASSSVTSIDATGTTFGWPEYLGDAVNGAYAIDDANDLDMLRKGVAAGLPTVGETFNQTANIDMATAGQFAGIGTYAANLNGGVPFTGTYDGQGYKISNVLFTQRNYGGIFNQVKGGTIKNLTVENISFPTVDWLVDNGNGTVTTNEYGCAIVGNAGLGATLQGLVASGSFCTAANPATHNVAGIVVRVCGGASNVVNGVTMLETLVKDCTNNATLYGKYTKAGGIAALTQDQNGVLNDYVKFDGCVNNGTITMTALSGTYNVAGRDGLAGVLAYMADDTKLENCVNNGTMTSTLGTAKIGELISYVWSNSAASQRRTLSDLGGNTAASNKKMLEYISGYATITGFQYATVDNGVATTTLTLAKDTTYLLEQNVAASETPVFTLAAADDTIAFDTALGYTFAGTVAAGEGLSVSTGTVGTVTTYTAVAPAANYKVVIEGSDVAITPTAADLAAFEAEGLTTPEQINAALDTVITNGVKVWEALFLGLPPTPAGLESFKITSITFDADGNVVVTLPNGVEPKTGRGVDIAIKLMKADTPNAPANGWTLVENAGGNDGKTFAPFAPGSTDAKKFYKVVVEYTASQN